MVHIAYPKILEFWDKSIVDDDVIKHIMTLFLKKKKKTH